jgi:site-specific recombinase XerC
MPRATTKAASLADGPTLASTRDYWILHLRSEGKSERTVSTYLRALDRLDAFLVERGMPRALGAIRLEHLESFFVALGELGNAPATISILFRAFRPFWRWLVEEDEIERSGWGQVQFPDFPGLCDVIGRSHPAGLVTRAVTFVTRSCPGPGRGNT